MSCGVVPRASCKHFFALFAVVMGACSGGEEAVREHEASAELSGTTEDLSCTDSQLHFSRRDGLFPEDACTGRWAYQIHRDPEMSHSRNVIHERAGQCRPDGSAGWDCHSDTGNIADVERLCPQSVMDETDELRTHYSDLVVIWDRWSWSVTPHPDDAEADIPTSGRVAVNCDVEVSFYPSSAMITAYAGTAGSPQPPNLTAECTTCDAMGQTRDDGADANGDPVLNPSATFECMREKLVRLLAELPTLESEPHLSPFVDGARQTQRALTRQLKKLFEFHAHDLNNAQISFALGLYENYRSIAPTEGQPHDLDEPSFECGLEVTTHRPSHCTAASPYLWRIDYCARMMSDHVPPSGATARCGCAVHDAHRALRRYGGHGALRSGPT